MNPLWRPPALRWKILSRGALVLAIYGAAALSMLEKGGKDYLVPWLLGGLFLPLPKHVFARFAATEATEWLMGMGLDRRRLAFVYAADLLGWALIHAAGGTLLCRLIQNDYLLKGLGWEGAGKGPLIFGSLFLIHLTGRAALAICAHLDRSTLIPARLRDSFHLGPSRAVNVAGLLALILILVALVVAPLLAARVSILWLAVPAALYLKLAHAMAASSEFARRAGPPVDDLGVVLPSAAPAPPPRQLNGALVADDAAAAPLRGLCWMGLARPIKLILAFSAVCLFCLALWWMSSPPFDRDVPALFLRLCAGVTLALLLLGSDQIFLWQKSDEAREYLFMRGVTLRTMSRVRMTAAMLVVAPALAFAADLYPRTPAPWRGVLAAMSLLFAAAALLSVNDRPFPRPFRRFSKVSDLSFWVRAPLWMSFVFMNPGLWAWLKIPAPVLPGVGLALFVPALGLWLWSYADLLARR